MKKKKVKLLKDKGFSPLPTTYSAGRHSSVSLKPSTSIFPVKRKTKTKVKNGGKTKSASRKKERHFCYVCNRDNCRHSVMKCFFRGGSGYCGVHKGYCKCFTSTTTTLSYDVYEKTWHDRLWDWLRGK